MAKQTQNMLMTVLGTVAMLIALLVAPISAGAAVSKPAVAAHSAHAMPCHKPATKPCPHCPQKTACLDVTSCLAKCAQTLAEGPRAAAEPVPFVLTKRAAPPHATAPRDQLIPPLLRPPIA